MARKKMKEEDKQQFQNVGLLKKDHDSLRELANKEQRSMARQLSVLIRRAVAETNTVWYNTQIARLVPPVWPTIN
jgi:hypothetical protein